MNLHVRYHLIGVSAALLLAACGGGGGGSGGSASSASSGTTAGNSATAAAVAPGAVSSGAVTAFGSVFVNGHEFSTRGATVVDDDAGSAPIATLTESNAASSGLAVGMTVHVVAASDSSAASPHAEILHIDPQARGWVDFSDTTAGTLQVMGQTAAISASTGFLDQRACATASTPTCTPITAQAGITSALQSCAASGSGYQNQGGGSTFTPGVYVQVFGFLSTTTGSAPSSTIEATLVRILDSTASPIFKAEGALSSVGSGTPPASFTLNNLTLSSTSACTSSTSCAFTAGEVVAARGRTTPVVTCGSTGISVSFTPTALQPRHGATLTSGATVELQGVVSDVVTSSTPATFSLDGVTIDVGSSLTVPAAGDRVVVVGTVNPDLSVTATAIRTEVSEAEQHTPFLIQDTLVANAVTGSAAPYTLAILGTTVQLDSGTRFFDFTQASNAGAGTQSPSGNGNAGSGQSSSPGSSTPFNINTVSSYLAAKGTPTVVVIGFQDTTVSPAVFHAQFLAIIPTSTNVQLGGRVTAVLSNGILDLDGIPVTVLSSTQVYPSGSPAGLALGDLVLVTQGSETVSGSAVTGVTAATLQDYHGQHMQPME